MSYKLNDKELLEHWGDQLTFIQSSIVNFDNGNEARRIATSLRIMFHQKLKNIPPASSLFSYPLVTPAIYGIYVYYIFRNNRCIIWEINFNGNI